MNTSIFARFIGIGAMAALTPLAEAAGPAQCPADGAASVTALHREWILVGWEKQAGDPPFDFKARLGKYYDWSATDMLLYDDFDPQYRVAKDPAEYGAIWTPPFTALKSARHAVIDGPDIVAGDGMVASTLEFAARLEEADGKVTGIRTRSSLVWRCSADGWKIVREHNSSRVIRNAEIDAILARLGK